MTPAEHVYLRVYDFDGEESLSEDAHFSLKGAVRLDEDEPTKVAVYQFVGFKTFEVEIKEVTK